MMKMLRWMCGVAKKDNILNERIRGTTRVLRASKKINREKGSNGRYSHVMRREEEHSVILRRTLDSKWPCNAKGMGTYSEKNARCGQVRKKKRVRRNLHGKDVCRRDRTIHPIHATAMLYRKRGIYST